MTVLLQYQEAEAKIVVRLSQPGIQWNPVPKNKAKKNRYFLTASFKREKKKPFAHQKKLDKLGTDWNKNVSI